MNFSVFNSARESHYASINFLLRTCLEIRRRWHIISWCNDSDYFWMCKVKQPRVWLWKMDVILFFLSVQLEMLRLKRIFCSFPRKSQDYLSYCRGLATAGSSIHSQVEWMHQSKTRCQFASPRIFTQNFLLSAGFLELDNSCSISVQDGISAVIFCQCWSRFMVIYFNFPLLIDEKMNRY